MKVSAFLKDKSGFFLLFCAEILLTLLFMTAYRSSTEQTVFIVTVISLCNFIRLVYEYMRKKSFYDKMAADCDRLDKKYLLCEMLEQPAFQKADFSMISFTAQINQCAKMFLTTGVRQRISGNI